MNMPTVPRLLRLRGNKSVTNKLFLATEALPTEARHEACAVFLLPNRGCRFRAHQPYSIRVANLERDRALGAAIPSSPNCIPSTQLAVLQADEREVHAVVVDMPQRATLEYASPDTWATLPNFDPPNEESPKPVLQVALN
jgi:hypothetical protein